MSNIITVNNLVKVFSKGPETLRILDNLNFTLDDEEKVVIIGESGSGKSTFLQILSGLDSYTSGSVKIIDKELSSLNENSLTLFRAQNIGLIFQFHYLLSDWSALENIYLPLYMNGTSLKVAKEKALYLLDSVNMYNRATHFPSELSGGERQRIAVARALVNDPKFILADEPTGNLDSKNSKIVEDILFNLVDKEHKSLVLVTHDLSLTDRASKSYKMIEGKLEC